MKYIPNKNRWNNWSLVSKATYVGFVIGIVAFVSFLVYLIYTEFIKTDYPKLSYEYVEKLALKDISDKEMEELIFRVEKEINKNINPETWDEYAKIILSIYHDIDTNAIKRINEKIFCDGTKKTHVIDLAIHSRVAGHEVLVAIKLLPIKDTLELDVVKYYSQILKEIKATKGVIICNGGFSNDAVEYAKKSMIDLCTLKDATSKKWADDIAIPVIWKDIIPNVQIHFVISFEKNDKIHKDPLKAILTNDGGETTFTIGEFFINKWNNNEIPHYTDSIIILGEEFNNLKIRVNNNEWRETCLEISYYTKVDYYIKYFTPLKYKAIENYVTGDVSISEFDLEIYIDLNDSVWRRIDPANINKKGLGFLVTTQMPVLKVLDFSTSKLTLTKRE